MTILQSPTIHEHVAQKIREFWSQLTDGEVALYDTNRDQFLEIIHQKYALEKQEIERQLHAIEDACCNVQRKMASNMAA